MNASVIAMYYTKSGGKDGVIDGARTRDNQNHNLGLYQLSYDHHLTLGRKISR